MARDHYLRACAWGVHLFTAAGAVIGLIALDRIAANDFRGAFFLMAAAIIIDSADGTIARLLRVRERLPVFDGATLDNIVDYLNYVAVPLLLILRAAILPRTAIGFGAASLAMLASAYGFSRIDAKTHDHYFRGFPSYWNVVALYLFCLGYRPLVNAAVIAVLAVMVFVPVKYIYPSRTELMRPITLAFSGVWAGATLALIPGLPAPNPILLYTSLAFVVYYFLMSFALHAHPQRRAASRSS